MKFIAKVLAWVLLLLIIKLAMPFVLKLIVTDWLESQGMNAQIGSVDLSLFDGEVNIKNTSGTDKNSRGFKLGQLSLSWQWRSMFDRSIVIDGLRVQSLQLDATWSENKFTNFAGFNLKASDKAVEKLTPQPSTKSWSIKLENSKIQDVSLCLKSANEAAQLPLGQCVQFDQLLWNGVIDYSPADQEMDNRWDIKGSLDLGGLEIHNNLHHHSLLKIESIAVNDVFVKSLSTIGIKNVFVDNFLIFQSQSKNALFKSPVFSFQKLNFRTIQLLALNDLQVGIIELKSLSSNLRLTREAWQDFDEWMQEYKRETAKNNEQVKTGGFRFLINEFMVSSNKEIIFSDERDSKPLTMMLKDLQIAATKISNYVDQQESSALMTFTLGNHGYVELEALGTLLSNQPRVTGKGKIVGVDLKMVAPLIRKHLQHNLNSGQLDSELQFTVKKGQVNGALRISFNQLALATLNEKERKDFKNEFDFPLNASLSLLRDRDNSIHLNIPVTGQFENPDFDLKQAIYSAVSNAVIEAIINYYTPYGLVFAAESLADFAGSLKLQPIIFASGSIELTDNQMEKLIVIAELMAQRPSIHITLCGVSNQKDKEQLFRKLMKSKFHQSHKKDSLSGTQEQLSLLENIAKERSAGIKRLLINHKGIDASRIVECMPQYDPEGMASVKVTI